MKRLGLIVALLAVIALLAAGREWLWRSNNRVLKASAVSPSGNFVAEGYLLDEGGGATYGRGPTPYGVGVYMRRTYLPLKFLDSTLIFASYCGPELHLRWSSSEELVIQCAAAQKPDFLLDSYGSVKINYQGQASDGMGTEKGTF